MGFGAAMTKIRVWKSQHCPGGIRFTPGILQLWDEGTKTAALPWGIKRFPVVFPAGTTGASPNSSPSAASTVSPVPAEPDGLAPHTSRPPENIPTADTSTLGQGTTALPVSPTDYAAGWANSQPPLGWFYPQRIFCFPFSPPFFLVRLLPASIPFLPLQLKISFFLLFSSFHPVRGLFHW